MGRRALYKRISTEEEPSVNLTPLIDVVFSILIMFIVIAPLLELDQVELADAGSMGQSLSVKDSGPISIYVHQDNTLRLNQRSVELAHLPALLKQEKKLHPEAKPMLFQDKRSNFGTYQAVKKAAEEAGFNEMDVILRPT